MALLQIIVKFSMSSQVFGLVGSCSDLSDCLYLTKNRWCRFLINFLRSRLGLFRELLGNFYFVLSDISSVGIVIHIDIKCWQITL